ncbi:MAG: hypothetical protein ACT4OU_08420 [Hyphomicrobium sp.]
MDSSIIVMIVTLALPNGDHSVSVKPMPDAAACQAEARIEASDPFVAEVECSELSDGKLELQFQKAQRRKIPEAAIDRSTG